MFGVPPGAFHLSTRGWPGLRGVALPRNDVTSGDQAEISSQKSTLPLTLAFPTLRGDEGRPGWSEGYPDTWQPSFGDSPGPVAPYLFDPM